MGVVVDEEVLEFGVFGEFEFLEGFNAVDG